MFLDATKCSRFKYILYVILIVFSVPEKFPTHSFIPPFS